MVNRVALDARRRVRQTSPWLGQGKSVRDKGAAAEATATTVSIDLVLVAAAFAAANPSIRRFPAPSAGLRCIARLRARVGRPRSDRLVQLETLCHFAQHG